MAGKDDDDVDLGWDDDPDDEPPATRAVDSARVMAEVSETLARAEEDAFEPPVPALDLGGESPTSEPPTTRRATDDEMRMMRTKSAGAAIRLSGRRTTPKVSSLALEAQRRDPPPTARLPQSPVPGLRLTNEVARKRADTLRRTTKVSVPTTRQPEGRVSEPPLDLHLDDLEVPADSGDPARHEAVTMPPPPPPPPPPGEAAPPSALAPAASEAPAPSDDAPSVTVESGEAAIEVEEESLSDEEAAALEAEDDPDLEPIKKRFDKGDYFGAAMRAEALLERRPDAEAARAYLDKARTALVQTYLAKLGSGDMVLRVAMRPAEIQGLSLDHRSGFLISLIDGVATIDEILDMSGMPQLDVLRLLYEMREQGVVVVES